MFAWQIRTVRNVLIVPPDNLLTNFAPEDGNRDGAQVIAQIERGMYIDDNATPYFTDDTEVWDHYNDVIEQINKTKATAWTPLSEAVFTALGYYGQNPERRLSNADNGYDPAAATPDPGEDADFYTFAEENFWPAGEEWPDPIQYSCQENHILLITEGASTADINENVEAFVLANPDTDTSDDACSDGLEGSTFLDDLTYFGQNAVVKGATADASNLYTELLPIDPEDPDTEYEKARITTHVITTGSLRDSGTGECNPLTLMTNAADQGAAPNGLLYGEDPDEVESNLRATLMALLNRSSAGSAASVISSSRTGEGASYQAVFWPEILRDGQLLDPTQAYSEDEPLTWVGDVHSFFVDARGAVWDDWSGGTPDGKRLTEDSNGNGWLDPGEDVGYPDPNDPTNIIGAGIIVSMVTGVCFSTTTRVESMVGRTPSRICLNDTANLLWPMF